MAPAAPLGEPEMQDTPTCRSPKPPSVSVQIGGLFL